MPPDDFSENPEFFYDSKILNNPNLPALWKLNTQNTSKSIQLKFFLHSYRFSLGYNM
jgi:hypothetical protein